MRLLEITRATAPTPIVTRLAQPLFWCALVAITYMALTPLAHMSEIPASDKSLHLAAFWYLTATMWLAYRHRMPLERMAIVLMGYGIGIEVVQGFMSYRYFGLLDLAADAMGIALGVGCVLGISALRAGSFEDQPGEAVDVDADAASRS